MAARLMHFTRDGFVLWWRERATKLGALLHQRSHRRTLPHGGGWEEVNQVRRWGCVGCVCESVWVLGARVHGCGPEVSFP
jgi:hypothetical protein